MGKGSGGGEGAGDPGDAAQEQQNLKPKVLFEDMLKLVGENGK